VSGHPETMNEFPAEYAPARFWCEIAPGPILGAGSAPKDGGLSEFRTKY
jgi:hypothetical protein